MAMLSDDRTINSNKSSSATDRCDEPIATAELMSSDNYNQFITAATKTVAMEDMTLEAVYRSNGMLVAEHVLNNEQSNSV